MNKFEEFNASVLVKQGTLLKKYEYLIKYLKENPSVNVYIYNGNFVEGTLIYNSSYLDKRNHEVKVDDLVLFKNGIIGRIDSIGEVNFVINNNFAFQGPQGPQGPSGESGTKLYRHRIVIKMVSPVEMNFYLVMTNTQSNLITSLSNLISLFETSVVRYSTDSGYHDLFNVLNLNSSVITYIDYQKQIQQVSYFFNSMKDAITPL